jgi:hypothetical protein
MRLYENKKRKFGKYDDFSRLLFLHARREASALANELPKESGQFRFLRAACSTNLKGSVGLLLAKASAMRISIPLVLSSRPSRPLPWFIHFSPLPRFYPSAFCLRSTVYDVYLSYYKSKARAKESMLGISLIALSAFIRIIVLA